MKIAYDYIYKASVELRSSKKLAKILEVKLYCSQTENEAMSVLAANVHGFILPTVCSCNGKLPEQRTAEEPQDNQF